MLSVVPYAAGLMISIDSHALIPLAITCPLGAVALAGCALLIKDIFFRPEPDYQVGYEEQRASFAADEEQWLRLTEGAAELK